MLQLYEKDDLEASLFYIYIKIVFCVQLVKKIGHVYMREREHVSMNTECLL